MDRTTKTTQLKIGAAAIACLLIITLFLVLLQDDNTSLPEPPRKKANHPKTVKNEYRAAPPLRETRDPDTTQAENPKPKEIQKPLPPVESPRIDTDALSAILVHRSAEVESRLRQDYPGRSLNSARVSASYENAENSASAVDDHAKIAGILNHDAPNQESVVNVVLETMRHLNSATDRKALALLVRWIAQQKQEFRANAAKHVIGSKIANPSKEYALLDARGANGFVRLEFGALDVIGHRELCVALGMDGVVSKQVYRANLVNAHLQGIVHCLKQESRISALPSLLSMYSGLSTSYSNTQNFEILHETEAAIKRCGGLLPDPADEIRKRLKKYKHLAFWQSQDVFKRLGASSRFQNLGQAVDKMLELLALYPEKSLMSNGINLGTMMVHSFNAANRKRDGSTLVSDVHSLLDSYERAKPAHRYALAGAVYAASLKVKAPDIAKRVLGFIEEDFPNPVEGGSALWAGYMANSLVVTDEIVAMRDLREYFYEDYPMDDARFKAAVSMSGPFLSRIQWTKEESTRAEVLALLKHYFQRADFLEAGYSHLGNDVIYKAIIELDWREAPEAFSKLIAMGEEKQVHERFVKRFKHILERIKLQFAAEEDE